MEIDLSVNAEKTADQIVEFIKERVAAAHFSKIIVGLSGGVDSAVSCALAVKALGREDVYVGLFPYGDLSKDGGEDAKFIIEKLKIPRKNTTEIDIKWTVDSLISLDPKMDNIRKGNIMVRTRMILLYDLSKKYKALVLGTENKTERLLGYYTRFGDEASDIEPIIHLYKTQVQQLAKYLKIPDRIIGKAPTAGLWQGQTDEGELGFPYDEADKILHLYHDQKKKIEEIINLGFSKDTVENVTKRVENNRFKHRLPYSLHEIKQPSQYQD